MDKSYIMKITSQAEKQIQEIVYYIIHELKAPDAALHLLDTLECSIISLAHFPQRVVLVDKELWQTNGQKIPSEFLLSCTLPSIDKAHTGLHIFPRKP